MKKFAVAFQGLFQAFHHPSVLVQGILACCACVAGVVLHLSSSEWIAVFLCIGLVLTTEILNTAIEKLCDLYSMETNAKIKQIKDLAAGAVLFSSITALVVAIWILMEHL